MTIDYVIHLFRRQIGEIRQQTGTIGLLKAGFRYALSPIYKSESFWLFVDKISAEYKSEASRPRIRMDRLNFKVITSNRKAEELEVEGFSFRSHPTYFNHNLTLYTKWLDYGAIACCTFVDKEFASISWVIPSKKTQDAIKAPPVKIDYANHEVFGRGAWSNPKYRGLGIYYFTTRNRNQFLLEKGFTTRRGVVDFTNKNGIGLLTAGSSKIYGTGRRLRILGRIFWTERYFEKPIVLEEAKKLLSMGEKH